MGYRTFLSGYRTLKPYRTIHPAITLQRTRFGYHQIELPAGIIAGHERKTRCDVSCPAGACGVQGTVPSRVGKPAISELRRVRDRCWWGEEPIHIVSG